MKENVYILEPLFGRMLSPFEQFLRRATAGGIILMSVTVATLLLANSPWGQFLHDFWEQRAGIGIGGFRVEMTLHHWVNEGLMALFFLLVGLELKREVLVGELSSLREAVLPVVAAVGGMVVPAILYILVNRDGVEAKGWGIPMATDIAFSLGILVLLSWRIPKSLIVFLAALAIADDLGAVLLIALYYSTSLDIGALKGALAILAVLALLNRGGIRHPLPYGVMGMALWLVLLHSGIHATVAGVLLAFFIPARPVFTPVEFEQRLDHLQETLRYEVEDPEACLQPLKCPVMATVAQNVEKSAKAVQSPLQRMEHHLSPWVTFVVIPLFALSNAGVNFSNMEVSRVLGQPVTWGIVLGLVLGKFAGVSGFSWFAVKCGFARLPSGVCWHHLVGVAWLAGIGFTMSLFINELAFDDPGMAIQAKVGILLASLLAGTIGVAWLLAVASAGKDDDPSPP